MGNTETDVDVLQFSENEFITQNLQQWIIVF